MADAIAHRCAPRLPTRHDMPATTAAGTRQHFLAAVDQLFNAPIFLQGQSTRAAAISARAPLILAAAEPGYFRFSLAALMRHLPRPMRLPA